MKSSMIVHQGLAGLKGIEASVFACWQSLWPRLLRLHSVRRVLFLVSVDKNLGHRGPIFLSCRPEGNRTPIGGFGDLCPTVERQAYLFILPVLPVLLNYDVKKY